MGCSASNCGRAENLGDGIIGIYSTDQLATKYEKDVDNTPKLIVENGEQVAEVFGVMAELAATTESGSRMVLGGMALVEYDHENKSLTVTDADPDAISEGESVMQPPLSTVSLVGVEIEHIADLGAGDTTQAKIVDYFSNPEGSLAGNGVTLGEHVVFGQHIEQPASV